MKRLLFCLGLLCAGSFAHAKTTEVHVFPPADGVFAPLVADPRELQYALRWVMPVSAHFFGEAAIGDYLGIYRWDVGSDAEVQFGGGGGFFGRFDMEARTNDLQVADYYANLPIDIRKGRWSGRFMPYHTSSHLGDDYIANTGESVTKHTWDVLRFTGAFEPGERCRVYGGYSYILRGLPGGYGHNAVQGGLEWKSKPFAHNHLSTFAASDFQSWQRVEWNPIFTTQVGLRISRSEKSAEAVSFIAEYMTGRQPHGQFFLRREDRWNFGVRFALK